MRARPFGVRGLGRLGGRLVLWMLRSIVGLGFVALLVVRIVVASREREKVLWKNCERRMVIRNCCAHDVHR